MPCSVLVWELMPGGVAGSKGIEVPGEGRAVVVLPGHRRDAQT